MDTGVAVLTTGGELRSVDVARGAVVATGTVVPAGGVLLPAPGAGVKVGTAVTVVPAVNVVTPTWPLHVSPAAQQPLLPSELTAHTSPASQYSPVVSQQDDPAGCNALVLTVGRTSWNSRATIIGVWELRPSSG